MPPHVSNHHRDAKRPGRDVVLTKSVMRAAERLGVAGKDLAPVLGVSTTTLSRMKKGAFILPEGSKEFELAALFVRLYRSLDAIVGGEDTVARQWLRNPNTALDERPAEKIKTIVGLLDVVAYLNSRKARV